MTGTDGPKAQASEIVVAGDSAGGCLVLAFLLKIKETLSSSVLHYVGSEEHFTNPLVSPYYGDFTGPPPCLIQVGQCEVLRDDGMAMAQKLKEAGVNTTLEVYNNMVHVFQFFSFALKPKMLSIKLGSLSSSTFLNEAHDFCSNNNNTKVALSYKNFVN